MATRQSSFIVKLYYSSQVHTAILVDFFKAMKIQIMDAETKSVIKEKENFMTQMFYFFIKICVIPIQKNEDGKIRFSLWSKKFLVFLVIFCPLTSYILMVDLYYFHGYFLEFIESFSQKNNIIDSVVSIYFIASILLSCPFSTMFIAAMASNFNCIKLIYPTNGHSLIISSLFFMVGMLLMLIASSLGNFDNLSLDRIVAVVLIPYFAMSYNILLWYFSSFVISAWISKLSKECRKANAETILERVDDILQSYKNLDRILGPFVAVFFTLFQVNWIIVIYTGFIAFFTDYSLECQICMGIGGLVTAGGCK